MKRRVGDKALMLDHFAIILAERGFTCQGRAALGEADHHLLVPLAGHQRPPLVVKGRIENWMLESYSALQIATKCPTTLFFQTPSPTKSRQHLIRAKVVLGQ
jgi:hypothetical protein